MKLIAHLTLWMLALFAMPASSNESMDLPAAMLVLYPTLTDDRPYPVSHFKDASLCMAEAARMNKNPEQSFNERARAVGAVAVCFTPIRGMTL